MHIVLEWAGKLVGWFGVVRLGAMRFEGMKER